MTTYQDTAYPGTNALLGFQHQMQGVMLGWLGYRAGRNSYALHANAADAAIHGAHALRRWWIWLFFIKLWILQTAFVGLLSYYTVHDRANPQDTYVLASQNDQLTAYLTNGRIFVPLGFVLVLVTYCRNVDYSLFQRRFVYHVMRPICALTNWIPNGIIYTLIVWVPLFGWIRWG